MGTLVRVMPALMNAHDCQSALARHPRHPGLFLTSDEENIDKMREICY